MLTAALVLLAACHRAPTKAERDASDARAIAAVEAAQDQRPPIVAVSPDGLTEGDMERFGLLGVGCALVPGTTPGGDPVVVAAPARATVKIQGRMRTFASDPGAVPLPMGAWTHYVGKELSLTVEQTGAPASRTTGGAGRFTIKDQWGRVVHSVEGKLTCGG